MDRYVDRMAAKDVELELAGRTVRLTSPGKVMFKQRGETKLDLVNFYVAIEDPLMRAMGGRPTLMQQVPQDGASGKNWFQKRVPRGCARLARAGDDVDAQRNDVERTRRRRHRAHRVGGEPGCPSLSLTAADRPGPVAQPELPRSSRGSCGTLARPAPNYTLYSSGGSF